MEIPAFVPRFLKLSCGSTTGASAGVIATGIAAAAPPVFLTILGSIDAGQTVTLSLSDFTKSGERFNLFTHKPENVTINCAEGFYFGAWN